MGVLNYVYPEKDIYYYMKLLFFSVIFFIIASNIYGQQTPETALNKLHEDYRQEKIYLWYNKSAYVAGETIWFKGYVFSGYNLSLISTSIYVELYDANKKLISSKLFPLVSGVAEGNFDLDNKLDEGIYYIRAYTEWMLNFDESLQYIHTIRVYNPASSKKLTLNNALWKAGAFPEGGSLIEGIETKVAVRRFSTVLLDNKWAGYLYDESNPAIKIKEFASLDENAALFSFTPQANKKYHVLASDRYGNNQVCSLPVVNTSGVKISVEDEGDFIAYSLKFQNIPGNGNGYSIIGQMQHQLAYQAYLEVESSEVSSKIPTDEIGNGILHLTLFDPLNNPIAERLVFVNHRKLEYDSTVLLQHDISGSRRAVSDIQIKVDSINWISYSVSVTEANAPSSVEEESILSALWLTSDIGTPIQNAANYFRDFDNKKADALDAIMISEKWQRFKWDEILNNKYPVITHSPFPFLSYTGRVTKGNKIRPGEEVTLLLHFPDSSSKVILAKTDSIGNIYFDDLIFYDELKIFYQLNNKKNNASLIDVDFERNNKFIPYSLPFPQTPYFLSASDSQNTTPAWVTTAVSNLKTQREIDKKFKTLQEVVISSKLKTPKELLNEQLSSGRFKSQSETIFDFVNENQTSAMMYSNILQWLNGRVPGFGIVPVDGVLVATIRGSKAAVFVDEIMTDPSYLDAIPISEIAMIKVIRGSAYALQVGVVGGGVIAIYTYRVGVRIPRKKVPSLPNNKIRGYDTVKKIFLPDYENKDIPQPEVDNRQQLLWQTLLIPSDILDRSTVVFSNNDNAKQVRIIVQGITDKGIPVYYEKIIDPLQRTF
jgi:hypothetical protein